MVTTDTAMVCLTRCYPCMFGQHPGGKHPWADSEDVLYAFITRHVDIRGLPCGCSCITTPAAPAPDDLEAAAPVDIHLDDPCAVCGAPGACSWDVEGRPLIHAGEGDDE